MKRISFSSLKQMVVWLIENDGSVLCDEYGRRWKFEKYKFLYRDIGTDSEFVEGLFCVHLWSDIVGYFESEVEE